jgi:hypothetical protein
MAKNMPWPKVAPPPRVNNTTPNTAKPCEKAIVVKNNNHLGAAKPIKDNNSVVAKARPKARVALRLGFKSISP